MSQTGSTTGAQSPTSSGSPGPRSGTPIWKRLVLVGGALVMLVVAGVAFFGYVIIPWQCPYGISRLTDEHLMVALRSYAEQNGGAYPAGEATPEASLSLLARLPAPYNAPADLLRGKSVPLEKTAAVLARGELLGPETCGWHYVEGLRVDDNPNIAMFWDKVGLGLHGEKLSPGDHIVTTVNGQQRLVAGAEWPSFLEAQKKLVAEREEWRERQQKEQEYLLKNSTLR
jgi:hypothetical protein